MKVYRVTDDDITIYIDPLCIKDHAEGLEVGEEITVKAVEMTEEEYYSLPSD